MSSQRWNPSKELFSDRNFSKQILQPFSGSFRNGPVSTSSSRLELRFKWGYQTFLWTLAIIMIFMGDMKQQGQLMHYKLAEDFVNSFDKWKVCRVEKM